MNNTKVATNLVGKQAQITMGCEVNDQTRELYTQAPRPVVHFGEKGQIVAVYQDEESVLMATLRINGYSDSTPHGGDLVDFPGKFLRLID